MPQAKAETHVKTKTHVKIEDHEEAEPRVKRETPKNADWHAGRAESDGYSNMKLRMGDMSKAIRLHDISNEHLPFRYPQLPEDLSACYYRPSLMHSSTAD